MIFLINLFSNFYERKGKYIVKFDRKRREE